MRVLLYIFISFPFLLRSQSVFTRVHLELSEDARCMEILDSCAGNGFGKDSVLYYKAMIRLKNGKLNEARELSKALMKEYPDFHEVHYLNGLIFISQENFGRSLNEFTRMIAYKPDHVKAYYNRALAFGMQEQYKKAICDLDSCLQHAPSYILAMYSRAYWKEIMGDLIGSVKDYEATLKLDPKFYDAYFGLANVYRRSGQWEKACETIRTAIKEGSQIAEEVKDNLCK